jgi:hypothetical protein
MGPTQGWQTITNPERNSLDFYTATNITLMDYLCKS